MPALAQGAPLKVGFMLPYTGTFAKLGKFIDEAFRLKVEQQGGKLGGRQVAFVQVDDESKPEAAIDNMNRLVGREKVAVVIGTVHSGVAMAMVKVARDTNTLLIIPNAGANEATGPACAPNIFRTSFSNWQPAFPMGKVMADAGHKNIVTMTWRYAAGQQMVDSFKENLAQTGSGAKIAEELYLPFPEVEFQALITRIATLRPDAVFSFFAGGGAVKFVKDYAAAGLKERIPLYGTGFLTEGVLAAQGDAAEGLLTTLHYADSLDNARNKAFRSAYARSYKTEPDVYAVQGFDTGLLLAQALDKSKGDIANVISAMEGAVIDSPRGQWKMSRAHNPIQNIYLRRVEKGDNKVIGIAWKALEDPARGCRLG